MIKEVIVRFGFSNECKEYKWVADKDLKIELACYVDGIYYVNLYRKKEKQMTKHEFPKDIVWNFCVVTDEK